MVDSPEITDTALILPAGDPLADKMLDIMAQHDAAVSSMETAMALHRRVIYDLNEQRRAFWQELAEREGVDYVEGETPYTAKIDTGARTVTIKPVGGEGEEETDA